MRKLTTASANRALLVFGTLTDYFFGVNASDAWSDSEMSDEEYSDEVIDAFFEGYLDGPRQRTSEILL
jgi:hypothetical protein